MLRNEGLTSPMRGLSATSPPGKDGLACEAAPLAAQTLAPGQKTEQAFRLPFCGQLVPFLLLGVKTDFAVKSGLCLAVQHELARAAFVSCIRTYKRLDHGKGQKAERVEKISTLNNCLSIQKSSIQPLGGVWLLNFTRTSDCIQMTIQVKSGLG